jgi:hypothetical protein
MSENLRVMQNRMVLLNPLVSLLKKNAAPASSILTPKTAGSNKPVQYVNSGGEETGDQDITQQTPRIPNIPQSNKPGSRPVGTAGDEVVTGRERV